MQALEQIEDPRRPSNGMLHDLREILVIAICAELSDAESFEDIAEWGQTKAAWLKRFLTLKNGIPSEDTFLRVFRLIDPKQFEMAFRAWTAGILPTLKRMESEAEGVGMIAIDSKTVRGSGRGGCQAIHMVSAFATQHGLVLGQEKVDEKSNEITAIPLLLESLYLKGLLVSIDAMGCQRDIAQHILKKEGDYLLAVKGNQPRLEQAVEAAVIDQGEHAEVHQTVMTAHGRDVIQQARVIPAAGWVDASLWQGFRTRMT